MAELVRYSRERILNQLNSRLGLTDETRDSFSRIISEVIGNELEAIEEEILDMFRNEQLENLSGASLEEYLFNTYNMNRLPASYAKSDYLQLYTANNQAFGFINNGNDIIIPEGTRVGDQPDFNGIIYLTTTEVVLGFNESFAVVPVIAESVGSSYNCFKDVLRYIDFENYSNSEEGLLLCRNIYDISNGADEENDDSLRFRGITFLERRSNLNKNALFAALLNEQSIFQFEIIESYYGIGTIGVLVKGHGYGEVSNDDVLRVQSIISEFEFLGQRIEVVLPRQVKLRLSLALKSNVNLDSNEKQQLINEIKSFIKLSLKQMEFIKRISIREIYNEILTNFNVRKLSSSQSNFDKIDMDKQERFGVASNYVEISTLGPGIINLSVDESFADPEIEIEID